MKKNKKILSIFIMAITLFSWLLPNFFVFASSNQGGRDISNDVVTNLTVSQNNINDGGNVKIHLDFEENQSTDIRSGDFIIVTWKDSGDAYFKGFSQNVELKVQDKYVGNAIITQNSAKITFNNNINGLDNVKGWAEFEVRGRNTTNNSNEDIKTAFIQCGTKKVEVNIKKSAAGTSGVFYYKTGRINTEDINHVQWWLNINTNKNYVKGEVRIKDNIQDGQTLDSNSFYITVDYYDGTHNYFNGEKAIQEFIKSCPGSSIYLKNNNISIYIPEEQISKKFISISYKTKITDPKQEFFVNKTKAWYHEYNKDAVSGESFDYSVKNIRADAGITGTVRGELKIVKTLKDKNVPIKDVEFELKRSDNHVIKDNRIKLTLKTDENGIANVKELPIGDYQLKEISAPDWIDFNPEKTKIYEFKVQENDTEGTLLNIQNELKMISIPVEKQWVGHNKDQVEIKLFAGKKEVGKTFLNSANKWRYTFLNMPEYDYETKQKINYSVSETAIDGYKTNIVWDNKNGFIITNTECPDLTIWKEVTGKLGDKTKLFNFNIILKQENGSPINEKFNCISSVDSKYENKITKPSYNEINFKDGKATIQLSHGQWVTIKDLPYGITYEVVEEEADKDGYSTTYNSDKVNNVNKKAKGKLEKDISIKVVNNKEDVPLTGISNTTDKGIIVGFGVFATGIFMLGVLFFFQLNKGLKR